MLDDHAKMMAYKAFVRSKIEYGNLIYWGRPRAISKNLTGFKAVLSRCSRTRLPSSSPRWKVGGRPRQLASPASCSMAKGGGR